MEKIRPCFDQYALYPDLQFDPDAGASHLGHKKSDNTEAQ
jgi:hypothetical protein